MGWVSIFSGTTHYSFVILALQPAVISGHSVEVELLNFCTSFSQALMVNSS